MRHPQLVRAIFGSLVVALPLVGFVCPISVNDETIVAPADTSDVNGNPNANSISGDPEWFADCAASYEHTQPGVQSEFTVTCERGGTPEQFADLLDPNDPMPSISVTLDGPGVIGDKAIIRPFTLTGDFVYTFPINRFGTYNPKVEVTADGMTVFTWSDESEVK